MDSHLKSNVILQGKTQTEYIDHFAIIMLIYNHLPDIPSLLIGSRYAKKIILINNNSNPEITKELENIAKIIGGKCSILQFTVNYGVSKAYNHAITSLDIDVNYIFLFDHDAIFDSDLFNQVFFAIKANKTKRWGVIVPIVADDRTLMKSNLGINDKYSLINSAITSGIFISREVFIKCGGFDESLFVEGADYDLTNRIKEAGYLLIRINMVLIIQEFEQPISGDKFLIKLLNSMIKYRSFIRIKINNCNIFRSKLSFYNKSREVELLNNLKKLRKGTLINKLTISVVILLNKLEMIVVKLIKNFDK